MNVLPRSEVLVVPTPATSIISWSRIRESITLLVILLALGGIIFLWCHIHVEFTKSFRCWAWAWSSKKSKSRWFEQPLHVSCTRCIAIFGKKGIIRMSRLFNSRNFHEFPKVNEGDLGSHGRESGSTNLGEKNTEFSSQRRIGARIEEAVQII